MKIDSFADRQDMYLSIPRGGVGAEIGVSKGYNAINLYTIAKPKTLHLVDTWQQKEGAVNEIGFPCPNHQGFKKQRQRYDNYSGLVADFFEQEISEGKVKLHRTDMFDWFSNIEENSLDWIYLDSNHWYDSVSKQIPLCVKALKNGGLLCGHDFNIPGRLWGIGVIAPVIENIQAGNLELIGFSTEERPSFMCKVIK